MINKIIFISMIVISVFSFSGCGGQGPTVEKNMSVSDETKILKIDFPEFDPLTNEKIVFDLNKYDFSGQMKEFSRYSKFHVTHYGGDIPLDHYKGLKINKLNNKYILEYSNGELNNNTWYLNSTNFTINYNIINSNEISFVLDNKYKYKPCENAIGVTIDPLDSLQNLENDSKNILSRLSNIQITLNKNYHFKGEVNSKYNADSIYANFKRLLGSFNWNAYSNNNKELLTEVKKENSFTFKVKDKSIPLHIGVYPYRNGSKVIYEAYIPYTINSKGTTSLTKKDIKRLKKKIVNIINN